MTSSVSPGSRNPTSNPVSAKTMKATPMSANAPKPAMRVFGSSQGMRAECTKSRSPVVCV